VGTLQIVTQKALEPLLVPGLRYYAAHGGRGSGKSFFFAGRVVEECLAVPGTRVVCVREVQKSLKESAKRLIEDQIHAFGVASQFVIRRDDIGTPGGGAILFVGMQDHTAESIKSLEGYRIAWIEEAHTLSTQSLEILRPTIRAPGSQIWASWNPRSAEDPIDQLLRGPNPPSDAVVVRVNYTDNPWFPAVLEAERLHSLSANPTRYGHIWLGEYEPQAIGALWYRQYFAQWRRTEAELPTMLRIVVAIDPAVSNTELSDMHGIVVCGLGEDQRGYVLEDGSLRGVPTAWAQRAVTLYDKWGADSIVIERNQGGDMCREVLRTVRQGLPVTEVTATRGKHVRAEPIAALYAQGRVSHLGTFQALENQLCLITASGYDGPGSPDNADAAIWALHHLMPGVVRAPARRERLREHESITAGGWMG
jgi:hypothetical protein